MMATRRTSALPCISDNNYRVYGTANTAAARRSEISEAIGVIWVGRYEEGAGGNATCPSSQPERNLIARCHIPHIVHLHR
jgi:hypothetical protein